MAEPIDVLLRSLLFFIILFFMTKIVGKKQISQISFFEYVSGITIGSIAAEIITGLETNIYYGIMSILLFGLVTLFVDFTSLKSKKFRDFVEGSGTIFIQDGKIQEDNLKKERYSADELMTLLRGKNVFRLADVEFAILEPTGDLNVLLKKENRPLTPKDLQLSVAKEKEPQIIIMDGMIINDALAAVGKNRAWLFLELDKLGVTLDNVFLAQVDSYGEISIDLYDDTVQLPSPQERPLLMALLKKCQADLESFSLETENEMAKSMYQKNAQKLTDAITRLTPYLRG